MKNVPKVIFLCVTFYKFLFLHSLTASISSDLKRDSHAVDCEHLYNLLSLSPSKRYKFDLANFRLPSGCLYCSSCDMTYTEEQEPEFLIHLGSRKHQDKVMGWKRKTRRRLHDDCSLTSQADMNHLLSLSPRGM